MTELFERFTYYGMRSVLVLFLVAATDASNPGLGMDRTTAGAVYGLYTGAVYLGSLPGGWIADRLIGPRRAVLWGALITMLGNFILAIPASASVFYFGLAVIAVGVGLLKPNATVLVGALYDGQPGARRDAGFSIFYVGINLGALVAPLIAGTIGETFNWRLGFLAAGVGMGAGAIQYKLTEGYLPDAEPQPTKLSAAARRRMGRLSALFLAFVLIFATLTLTGIVQISVLSLAKIFGTALIGLAVFFFLNLLLVARLTRGERAHVGVIAILFVCSALFWAGSGQHATTFNLFALDYTDRSSFGHLFREGVHPASWYQSINPIFIVLFAPFFAWLWVALGARNRDPGIPVKFGLGLILQGLGFLVLMLAAQLIVATGNQAAPTWLLMAYLLHTFGELCLSPVGLSTVTKLAPARYAGQMIGTWFLGTAVGNVFAGLIGGHVGSLDAATLPEQFLLMTVTGVGSGVLMLAFAGPIRNWIGTAQ